MGLLKSASQYRTIIDTLNDHAESQSEDLAYRFLAGHNQEQSLTYEALLQQVRRVACYLTRFVEPSDRVLLLLPSGTDYLVTLLACFWQGIVAVTAYPPKIAGSRSRLLSILQDCHPKALITTSDVIANFANKPEEYSFLNQLVSIPVEVALATPGEPSASLASSSRLAFLQYTSGSTSAPKGVMVTHANLMANLDMLYQALQLDKDDIHMSWLPLFHDMGLICGTLLGLYAQNPVVFMNPVNFVSSPIKWLKAITDYGATISGGPNFAYDLCCQRIEEADLAPIDLSRWRLAYNAAEPVRWETMKAFERKFGVCGFSKKAFFPAYGMAETTLIVSGQVKTEHPAVMYLDREALGRDRAVLASPDAASSVPIVCCGRCDWGDQEVKIVDPATKQERNTLNIGEIWVKGSHVTQGIYGNSEATQSVYGLKTAQGNDGFFSTGDLGFLDEKRNLYITGRIKDLIIINGQNFYPQDIEQVAEKSSLVVVQNGTAAMMQPGSASQVTLVAEMNKSFYRQGVPDYQSVVNTLISAVAKEIGLILKECVLVSQRSLPKTSSGKIQRQKVRAMLETPEFETLWRYIAPDEPVDEHDTVDALVSLEEKVVAYCRHWIASRLACAVELVNLETPLMSLGLDSLNAIDLLSGIDRMIGKKVDQNLLHQGNSIASLARLIAGSA